jgi:16S rRNA (cytosine1402-N4)-methyltransferase
VLLPEVLTALAPKDGQCVIDGTFGAGGYTRAILDAADTRVWAIDRDPGAIAAGASLVAEYAPRLTLTEMRFGSLLDVAADKAGTFDGLVLDLGVSSMQLDEAERGFSFRADGPLDMRMASAAENGPSAADVVNTADETLLADILYRLGEERRSRAIAHAIVQRRRERPMTRTLELADLVAGVLGRHQVDGRHPATRTFQALRIYVNDELAELARALLAAEVLLASGGRLAVVTFHSLEDRIVKRFLAERGGRTPGPSRHQPVVGEARAPSFQILNPNPVLPGKAEVAANPRARSAKLRAGVRTAEPAGARDERAIEALVPVRPQQ